MFQPGGASGDSMTVAERRPRMVFFTFPENARWNPERSAAEFGVSVGEYAGIVRVPRRIFQPILTETPTPERCTEAYYLNRPRLQRIADRTLRRRPLRSYTT